MTIGVGISNYAASATSVSGLNTPTGKTSQVSGSSFYIALFYVTSGAPTTVTDTFSNVYTAVTAEVQNTSDGGFMRVYQCQNGTGGANHQAGVAWSPTQLGVIMFVEVTGGVTSSILDQQNCVYDNGGSPFSCVLPTTTNAPDLLLGFTIVQTPNTSESFSSPTLTNTVFSFNFSNTSLFAGAAMSARVTSTGAYDAAISDTAGYSKAVVAMLALKEGGGAPSGMRQVGLGPGTTPDTKTMFTPRPVSSFIVQGTSKGVASGQGFAVGLLTGAIIVPVIGYVRTSGPGISPDYKRTFDQIPRSTALPNFAQLTGRALGSGSALASLTGVAAIQGLSLGQGFGVAGPLLGAGSLAGRASAEGNALGLLGSGAVSSITGVALGSGYSFGTVTATGALRGVASSEGAARATLTGAGVLSGQAVGNGFGRGTLLGSASLSGVGVGSGYAFGLAGAGGNLTGFAFGSGYANAALTGSGALAGRASAEGAAKAGPLAGAGALRGSAYGQGSALATMQGAAPIQGVALGQAHGLGLLLPVGSGQMHGIAAGFSYSYGELTGGIHSYGYAVVTAVSQNGLPVARACYIEESASIIIASYFDNTGAPFVPNAVQYRIDDVVSGANILPWTALTPATGNEVTITSAQNAMINNSRTSEAHQVLLQITDGLGKVTYADTRFDLIRVPGLD